MTYRGIHRRLIALTALALAACIAMPASAPAIMRQTVLSRARVWVAYRVPYSQAGWANSFGTVTPDATKGWRRDCSGFISMAMDFRTWNNAPLSLDTATLPARLNRITKDELMPGDIILRPKNQPGASYGHAVMFVYWTDSTRTKYVGYHESSSAGRATEATITYPFGTATGFAPYRFRSIAGTLPPVRIRRAIPPSTRNKIAWP